MSDTTIRPAGLHDLAGAYRVCLHTSDSGEDGSAHYLDPELLGHIYVGPYLVGSPHLSWVIADERGVGGYTLAVPDTRAFEAWQEREWWPALRAAYPGPIGSPNDDELIELLHSPVRPPEEMVAEYPAHLHIDLLPRMQGGGHGRTLMTLALDTLRGQGVRGVHLDVGEDNHNAISFYHHLGFTQVGRAASSYYLGMRLS